MVDIELYRGTWFVSDDATEGFITERKIGGIDAKPISGRLSVTPSGAVLFLHAVVNGNPRAYGVSGSYNREEGVFSFTSDGVQPLTKFLTDADSDFDIIKELGKQRRSARSHYGDVVYEAKYDDLIFDFHGDWAALPRKIRARMPDSGRFTVLKGFKYYYFAMSNPGTGHLLYIGKNSEPDSNEAYVRHVRITGSREPKGGADGRHDWDTDNTGTLARFSHPDDQDIAIGKARSYAKSVLDYYRIA